MNVLRSATEDENREKERKAIATKALEKLGEATMAKEESKIDNTELCA